MTTLDAVEAASRTQCDILSQTVAWQQLEQKFVREATLCFSVVVRSEAKQLALYLFMSLALDVTGNFVHAVCSQPKLCSADLSQPANPQ